MTWTKDPQKIGLSGGRCDCDRCNDPGLEEEKMETAKEKLKICENAIDALIDLANAGLGNWQTSDALTWINKKQSEALKEMDAQ